MKMNGRMLLRVAAAVIVVGVIGWQWWGPDRASTPTSPATHDHGVADQPASGAAASASAAPAKPATATPPATITLGKLTLTGCQLQRPHSAVTTPAFCATLPVPENRADPDSRVIDLKLAIVKSNSQVPARDLVVYLAGGPGQSAIETWPEMAPAFSSLLKHHDVLLLDQRGTGGSNPLLCPEVAGKMKASVAKVPDLAERAALVGECAQEVQKTSDPRYYTTTEAVADLEAVREALGSPKFDLVGVSYGTRVAQHYAAAHPDAVRSIVLDGVVPNTLVLGETFAAALQRSLQLQSAACSATPACKQAFGDWYATLHSLYDKLKQQPPQQVTFNDPQTFEQVTRTLTADRLAGLARFFSYSAVTQALLPLAVEEAAKGNFAPLMGQSELMTGSVSQSMQGGMQLSVICTEDASLLTPRPQDADTLLGNQLITGFIAECKAWPHGPMPKGFHAPFKSSIPTLLISGERDPVTPPSYAAEVLEGLSSARSLVVAGLGHAEAINAGCMPKLVNQFIDRLDPQQLDAGCLKKLGPIPAFVNFNGATP